LPSRQRKSTLARSGFLTRNAFASSRWWFRVIRFPDQFSDLFQVCKSAHFLRQQWHVVTVESPKRRSNLLKPGLLTLHTSATKLAIVVLVLDPIDNQFSDRNLLLLQQFQV